jgi:uncharacterized protein (DUF2132 family)
MKINLTIEQMEQVKNESLKLAKTEELLGELVSRYAIEGDTEKVNTLCEYQKQLKTK